MITGLGLVPLTAARSQFAFRFIDRAGISRQITIEGHDTQEALDVLLEAVPAIVDLIASTPTPPTVRPPMARETPWPSSHGDNASEVYGTEAYVSPPPNGGRY